MYYANKHGRFYKPVSVDGSQYNRFIPVSIGYYNGRIIGGIKSLQKDKNLFINVIKFIGDEVLYQFPNFMEESEKWYIREITFGDFIFYAIEFESRDIEIYSRDGELMEFPPIPLSRAIKVAVKKVQSGLADIAFCLDKYSKRNFTSEVEEKNYIQKSISILGDDTFKCLLPGFKFDIFFAAVERAALCDSYSSRRYFCMIPCAEEIFKIYSELCFRWEVLD